MGGDISKLFGPIMVIVSPLSRAKFPFQIATHGLYMGLTNHLRYEYLGWSSHHAWRISQGVNSLTLDTNTPPKSSLINPFLS